MATIGELARTFAAATGIPDATMAVTARELRRRGVLTSEGKGFGASQMGPSDAAALLLATMASDTVKDSPDVATEFSALPGSMVDPPRWAKRAVSDFENRVGNKPALIWAVGELIGLLSLGLLFPPFAKDDGSANVPTFRPRRISLTIFRPVPAASIEIRQNRFSVGYRFGALAGLDLDKDADIMSRYEEIVAKRHRDGYIVKVANVGTATLAMIAEAIKES
jgi:hypothetical protein